MPRGGRYEVQGQEQKVLCPREYYEQSDWATKCILCILLLCLNKINGLGINKSSKTSKMLSISQCQKENLFHPIKNRKTNAQNGMK